VHSLSLSLSVYSAEEASANNEYPSKKSKGIKRARGQKTVQVPKIKKMKAALIACRLAPRLLAFLHSMRDITKEQLNHRVSSTTSYCGRIDKQVHAYVLQKSLCETTGFFFPLLSRSLEKASQLRVSSTSTSVARFNMPGVVFFELLRINPGFFDSST